MIVAAAVCPHPPLLLRELTGLEDVAEDLRKACGAAIRPLLDADVIVVVGGADTSGTWSASEPFDVTRFGTTQGRLTTRSHLPLSLGVAGRLLDDAGWSGPRELVAVAWDAPQAELAERGAGLAARPERLGLLVMGEGSARRGQTAPGYIDDRAPAFDERLGRALGSGDAAALRDLDLVLADQLMVLGRSSLQVLGHALTEVSTATMLFEDDPFGVMYLVSVWQLA